MIRDSVDGANRAAVERVLFETHYHEGYLFPAYHDYCFANVSSTALAALGVDVGRTLPDDALGPAPETAGNVLLVVLDGLRYDRWLESIDRISLFERIDEHGSLVPLTSTYPSETAAAITTLHTGRQPIEHGVLGWEQYLPSSGLQVEPLPGRIVDGPTLVDATTDFDPTVLLDVRTVYDRLLEAGVESTLLHPYAISGSPFDELVTAGARKANYDTVAELAVEARTALERSGQSYVVAYLPQLDTLSHHRGTETEHYAPTVALLASAIERELERIDPAVAEETLVLITADHGHLDTAPGVGLDLERFLGPLTDAILRADGTRRRPTGGARNVHLWVEDGRADEVRDGIRADRDARAWTREESVAVGLFGDDEPSTRFEERCGDVVFTHREQCVWDDHHTFKHAGVHGGLHPDEMLVPFAAAQLSRLQP